MTGITIRMTPQTVLSGKVTGEDGDPLPRVTVRPMRPMFAGGALQIATAGAGVQTDDEGEFHLTVAPGRWYLSYSAAKAAAPTQPERAAKAGAAGDIERDYVSTYYPGVTDVNGILPVDVVAGQDRPGLDVRLRKKPVFHIRGKIAGGLPLDSMRILAAQEGVDLNAGTFDQLQSPAPDGSFDIGGLPSGSWTLTVMQRDSVAQRTVEIGTHDMEDVVLTARPPADIGGTVKIVPDAASNSTPPETGSPALQVRLTPVDGLVGFASAPVSRDGSFTLKGAGARQFRADATTPPGGYVKSVLFGGQEAIDSGIDLTEGVPASPIQIVISMTAGQVGGVVNGEDGQPPATAVVTLFPELPDRPSGIYRADLRKTMQTDAAGQFTVTNVAPGKYRVYAWERFDATFFTDPALVKLFDSMSAAVTVGESGLERVTLTCISAARLDDEIRRHGR